MALKNVINEASRDAKLREDAKNTLYRNERSYRVKESIKAWAPVAGIGNKLSEMKMEEASNVVMQLNQEANHLANLTEAQRSNAFAPFTPDNMLRLVVLTFPQCNRGKIFTEFNSLAA